MPGRTHLFFGMAVLACTAMTHQTQVANGNDAPFTWRTTQTIVDVGRSVSHRAGFRVTVSPTQPPWRYTPRSMKYTPKARWIYSPKRDFTYTPKRVWTYTPKRDFTYKPKRFGRWPWHQPQRLKGPQVIELPPVSPE